MSVTGGAEVLRFSLLGPLRAWRAGTELPLGPPQQRAVLAVLLLRGGRAAGVGELVDGVWGPSPPSGAVPMLRTYVSRLRRLLEPARPAGAPPRLVVSVGDGYALRTEEITSDLGVFEEYLARAERRRAAGDSRGAARLLESALAAWQGAALGGVPGPLARAERTRLTERRLGAQEYRLRVELELGRHETVLPELKALRDAQPLREAVCELLLVALYRCGRRAEALEIYARTRRTLVDELGIEPGPSLRAAHARLLSGDPDLSPPAVPVPAAAASATTSTTADGKAGAGTGPADDHDGTEPVRARSDTRPSQLPADLALFTGREAELGLVEALLPAADHPDKAVIGLVNGMAGAGKTTLAVHWAHRVAHRFPDGSLYVNLRGYTQGGSVMHPSEALETFLVALGVAPQAVPEGLDAQAALYRSVLARRRVLIVLDNARDTEQIRPLLPGTPGCLVIVTSRSRLTGLVAGHGAHPLTLGALTGDEARAMLTRRIGRARVEAEPQATDAIVELCARLPLALAIVAARAAHHPGFRLADIAAELRENHGSLDAFTGGDARTDVRAVFSWSYHALPRQAAELFRRLSLHPGPDIGTAAAAALAAEPARTVRARLSELTGASLLGEHAPGRYAFHDLLRAYAGELADAEDGAERRAAALLRLHDHYLHTTHNASATIGPLRETLPLPSSTTDSGPLRFTGRKQAMNWLRAERHVLRAVVEQAAALGHEDHAWRTAVGLDLYFDRLGFWHDLMEINSAALRAARAVGDRTGEAHALRGLGFFHTRFAHSAEARRDLGRALELFRAEGDAFGEARTRRCLAYQANGEGRFAVSLDHYAHARELYRGEGSTSSEAIVLNEVGWTYILLGEHDKALEHCEKAVALHQEIGDPVGEAAAQDSVGYAHHQLGQYGAAVERFERAVALYREIGDHYLEADTLRHAGDAHLAAGDRETAVAAFGRALALLEETGHPEAPDLRETLRGLDEPGRGDTGRGGSGST
ncbi:BTAD domain-containing putative transcriptional regulator [Streptomyces sp. NPDC060188]|uniref:AfsR/SARP family transcriptional regulator n=1 Tax=Streptomyces sp. NPDC060188 TaxID=3347068 RepID=UPI00364C91FC